MQEIRLKGHVGPGKKLKIMEDADDLPEGDVEVILLYQQDQPGGKLKGLSPLTWPVLDGKCYLVKSLRREDFYSDDGR